LGFEAELDRDIARRRAYPIEDVMKLCRHRPERTDTPRPIAPYRQAIG